MSMIIEIISATAFGKHTEHKVVYDRRDIQRLENLLITEIMLKNPSLTLEQTENIRKIISENIRGVLID